MTQEYIHYHETFVEGDSIVGVVIMHAGGVFGVFQPALAHRECAWRQDHGGIGHHLNHKYWCEQQHDQDAGRTIRQSALEVAAGHYGRN